MMGLSNHSAVPGWFWATAILGLVWNAYGSFQFLNTAGGTVDSLMAGGLTKAQAALYVGLPVWVNGSFAVGVLGGLIGSALLLMRKAAAKPVFVVSLLAYVVLFIGDITQGVFAVMGVSQVVIMITVVAIAAVLLWLSTKPVAVSGS